MSVPLRWFRKELEDQGFQIQQTNKGHYWVIIPEGGKLIVFAVTHGSNSKGGEVRKQYVNQVRNSIQKYFGETE